MTVALYDDDLLPPVKPGRRVDDPFRRLTRRSPLTCGQCPEWKRTTFVCLVRGCHQAPDVQACRYGANLIRKGGQ